ncbi:MAG: hypothetical protein AMXMBFR61_27290 [Fimbriimonadales bacterium]
MAFLFSLLLFVAQTGPIPPEQVAAAHSDVFAATLGAAPASAAALRAMTHPFVGKAVIGLPGYSVEVAVTPDGGVLAPVGPYRLWFQAFDEIGKGYAPIFAGGSRSWPDLRAPLVENKRRHGDLLWTQHAFITPEGPGRGRLVVRITCENLSEAHLLVGPTIGFCYLSSTAPPWIDKNQQPLPAPALPSVSRIAVSFQGYHLVPLPRLLTVADGGLPEPWMAYRMPLTKQALPAHETVEWVLALNLWEDNSAHAALDLERSLKEMRDAWDNVFAKVAEYSVPDLALVRIRNQMLAQLLTLSDGDQMPRGGFPSALATERVGVQEAWAIQALAEWGLAFEAATLCDGTFFTEEFRAKDNRHHQYRAGLTGKLAWDLYAVTGDRIWLEISLPWISDAANWIAEQLEKHQGVLAPYRFGLDVDKTTLGLWPNAVAWRGLRDAALALEKLGHGEEAAQARRTAEAYRHRLLEMFEKAPGRSRQSGYLPLAPEDSATQMTTEAEYAQFASLLLETGLLRPGSTTEDDLLRYLARTGRIQAGLAAGRTGDQVVLFGPASLGLQLSRLRAGDAQGFLLGLYGMLGLCMDADWFTAQETSPLMGKEEADAQRKAQESRFALSTEPAGALPGVVLQCLRRMFVYEERDADELPTGVVQLLPAIPARWLDQTKPFYVKQLPTVCGKVSVVVMPEKGKITYRIRHHGAGVYALKEFRLRLPAHAKSVKVVTGQAAGPQKDGWLPLAPGTEIVVTITR